ncbi:CPBP family intramembrane metalloprotease [Arthrobacter sp. Sa2BUA2]|uniref:CPBP family intramembrane metalloprotease n=1 Tax=Arthrobacter pullicola TaxID=2762224 RepID=A0ABR8YL20_9MICC|nr:CPBP family glutamic-type intramembrane protease [Arthrobacter pullicola]MBD8044913.1 CPBP family intramembrane metalloprotease [Arthrobacter pullicola]
MAARTWNTGARDLAGFAGRVLLPAAGLGIALAVLYRLTSGTDPVALPTLVLRIASGAVVSACVLGWIIGLAHRRGAGTPGRADGVVPFLDGVRAFAMGGAVWLVPAAAAFGMLALFGFPLTVVATPAELAATVLLLFAAVLLSEAVPEEIVFRGYMMRVLGERLRGLWANVVQAALFAAFALVLRGWTGTADLLLFLGMGLGLGYVRTVSGSVWTTVGFHTAFQTGAQLVLTHDAVDFSGADGLSMLALGVVPFAAGIILVDLLAPSHPRLFARQRQKAAPE